MKRVRPLLNSADGAAAVELALVMPILFLLLFGIFEFGRAYNAQVSLTGATREGARHMAITGDAPAAEQKVIAAAALLDTTPTVQITDSSDAAVTTCAPDTDVVVTASATVAYNIPFFDTGSWTVTGKAVMRCGG